jgi:hypothetical protein
LFTPLPFEKLNETDVREEVIAPLLRQLGYKAGSENNIIREQSLRYPKISLGLKNPKKDPELRGKADYILEVGSRLRWVIEAKAPQIAIDRDAIEQAWTYASHPEIRAIYFVLCNGRTLSVFRTVQGPDVGAVFSLPYEEFDGRFQLLVNLLSPEALSLTFPNVEIDEGHPLAPGLQSLARITNGIIRYEHNSLSLALLDELQIWIADGAAERDENTGKLIAFLKTTVGSRSLQELNERLGLAEFEMLSEDTELSTDPAHPTVFWYRGTITLAEGEEILNMATWQHVKLSQNVTCDIVAKAQGVYRERLFSGAFETFTRYREFGLALSLAGSFEIHLA